MNNICHPIRGEPLYKQIELHIRGLIDNGTYKPGERLPSGQELAKSMGSSIIPVQTALKRLCFEGLLERKPRVGTFVKGGEKRLTSVGMYLCGDALWQNAELGFFQVLCRELVRLFEKEGTALHTYVDTRRDLPRSTPLPSLRRAVVSGKVQAVVSPICRDGATPWLESLGVPVALLGLTRMLPKIKTNELHMMREVMKFFREQGCRTVGIIPGVDVKRFSDFILSFTDAARDAGLEIRNEWILHPHEFRETGMYNSAGEKTSLLQYGYEKFIELWKKTSRPDGLIIYPDMAVHGAMQAMRILRVEPPRDIKLALHANKQIPYPCPEPHIKLVTDIADVAGALIKVIHRQISNETKEDIIVRCIVDRDGEHYFDKVKNQNQ